MKNEGINSVRALLIAAVLFFSGYAQLSPIRTKEVGFEQIGGNPIKTTASSGRKLLAVGGQPFGIKLIADGVMVIALGEVASPLGNASPASEAGLQSGDVIMYVNGSRLNGSMQLQEEILESDGGSLSLGIVRDDDNLTIDLKPVQLPDGSFCAGIWVRDSSAGIGTVTFYDPLTHRFGGLGHAVCDIDTGDVIAISSGEVASVEITGARRGTAGCPGELAGHFINDSAGGSIELNSDCGVFGTCFNIPDDAGYFPLASKHEVKTGNATILTTLNGCDPKEYTINIDKISMTDDSNRSLRITVTDEELIKATGGIVQGMSGSPILQDGKLIGAVTHVMLNDPARGYGIFAETMYECIE